MHEDSCIGINYAHVHKFTKCFKSLHTLLGFALCFVSSIFNSCRCNHLLNFDLYANSLKLFTLRKRVFRGVVFTHPVGYSRPPSAVNDLSVKKWNEFVKAIRLRFSPKICKQRVAPFYHKPLHASSFIDFL